MLIGFEHMNRKNLIKFSVFVSLLLSESIAFAVDISADAFGEWSSADHSYITKVNEYLGNSSALPVKSTHDNFFGFGGGISTLFGKNLRQGISAHFTSSLSNISHSNGFSQSIKSRISILQAEIDYLFPLYPKKNSTSKSKKGKLELFLSVGTGYNRVNHSFELLDNPNRSSLNYALTSENCLFSAGLFGMASIFGSVSIFVKGSYQSLTPISTKIAVKSFTVKGEDVRHRFVELGLQSSSKKSWHRGVASAGFLIFF
jgi:hypothetical protein